MPRKKAALAQAINLEQQKQLERMEAGLKTTIGDKDINQLYKEKLNQEIDVDEPLSKTLTKPKGRVKKEKPVKELTEKGKRASESLSKYRQQVKEALEFKKAMENKNKIIYSEDEDEDEDEDEAKPLPTIVAKPTPVIQQQPQVDLSPLYSELESLKKKNKELEDKFIYKSNIMDLTTQRRNIMIKF